MDTIIKPSLILASTISVGVISALLADLAITKYNKKQISDNDSSEDENPLDDAQMRSKYKVQLSRQKAVTIVREDIQALYPRLKIPRNAEQEAQPGFEENRLIEELRALDNPMCEIERIHNLITDNGLTSIDDIVTPKESQAKSFVFTNAFTLYKVEYGPTCSVRSAKRWLRAGPRFNLYFRPSEVKALIVTVGSIVPGINVVIRELVCSLNFVYGVEEVYGAKFGFSGLVQEELIHLTAEMVKKTHTEGGSYLGVSRGGFDKEKILKTIKKHHFNQVYIIGGHGSLSGANYLHAEIQKQKLNVALCVIPKSVQGDIPIAEEQMGFQTIIEETSKAVEAGFEESQSHDYGVALVRCFGRSSGFIAANVAEAARCVDIVLVPEFQWDLNGENGVLEYIRQTLLEKKHLIVMVSEGAVNSLRDVELSDENLDEMGNSRYVNIGEFLKDQIADHCKKRGVPVTVKFIDPLYITRACRASPHDTKIASQMAQNAVHGVMAGFTAFSPVIVHHKTTFVSFTEMISGNYETRLVPNNRQWQRVLAQTLQPSFLNDEDALVKNLSA